MNRVAQFGAVRIWPNLPKRCLITVTLGLTHINQNVRYPHFGRFAASRSEGPVRALLALAGQTASGKRSEEQRALIG